MFILRRKQVTMILCSLYLSFSFYLATDNTAQRSFDIKQVSTLPVDSKVIVIDAGHRSEKMVGAVGPNRYR